MFKKIVKGLSSSEKDTEAINQIAIKCTIPSEDVAKVMATMYKHIMQEFIRQGKVYVPFIGEMSFDYKGDKPTDRGVISEVDTKIELSNTLAQDIARFENEENTYFNTFEVEDILDNLSEDLL